MYLKSMLYHIKCIVCHHFHPWLYIPSPFFILYSEVAKVEVESKQKGYATHEEAKQAFKDLLREKVHAHHHYDLANMLLSC